MTIARPLLMLGLSVLGVVAGVQSTPTRALGKLLGEHPEPFSGILEVRELASGSVIVLDAKDNLLQFLSPDLKTGTRVSRVGLGPAEYRRVMQLIAHRGDTTYAYDVMNARFLVIDPRGPPRRRCRCAMHLAVCLSDQWPFVAMTSGAACITRG